MFIFVVFVLGMTALVLIVYINTISVISGLQESPAYKTRQALLNERIRSSVPRSDSSGWIDISTWKMYRNEKHGFEVRYPKEWYVNSDFGNIIEMGSVPKENYVHGFGIPNRGGSWIEIYNGQCKKIHDDFQSNSESLGIHSVSKTVCIKHFQITLGYTDNFHDQLPENSIQENKNILNAILYTFKSTQ